ncbi:MAG: glycosyltransferase family 4 protein, partial [Novosphingobium sp.]
LIDPAPASAADPLRVTWVSPSYGYGGDMLYFKGLFEAVCARFPATTILIDHRVGYREADNLALRSGLEGWVIGAERAVGSARYDAGVHVPYPSFLRRLAGTRPQAIVVIEFTIAALLAITWARLRGNVAVLLLVESDPAGRGASGNRVVLALKRWACRKADAIQTCNEGGFRFLTQVLRADPAKVRVAPYLTSCPPPPTVQPPRTGKRLHLLFVNSLSARKGCRQLLGGLALLPPAIAGRIDLTIVGDGPERPALEALAAKLTGIPVHFAGAQPYAQLGKFYAAADVLAVPSLADYRSLAGFEGLGHGLALLASTADGASTETLDGGRTGIAIDPANPAGIAAAIARMVEDPAMLAGMQRNAAALFAARFSFARIADNLVTSLQLAIAANLRRNGLDERKVNQ